MNLSLQIAAHIADYGSSSGLAIAMLYLAIPIILYLDAVNHGVARPFLWAFCAMQPGVWIFAITGYLIGRFGIIDITTKSQKRASRIRQVLTTAYLLILGALFLWVDLFIFRNRLGRLSALMVSLLGIYYQHRLRKRTE